MLPVTDGVCVTEGDTDALEVALGVCVSVGVPDDEPVSEVDTLALGVTVCVRLGECVPVDD